MKQRTMIAVFSLFFVLIAANLAAQHTQIFATPANIDFGEVPVGSTLIRPVDIGTHLMSINITGAYLTGDSQFTIQYLPALPYPINATAAMRLEIGFNPVTLGPAVGTVHLNASSGSDLEIPLTGMGTMGAPTPMLLVPGQQVFGDVAVGVTSTIFFPVSLTSAWTSTHSNGTILSAGINGSDHYSINAVNLQSTGEPITFPFTLTPGDTLLFTVDFAPISAGEEYATVVLSADDGLEYLVELVGNGIDTGPHIELNPNSFIMSVAQGTTKTGIQDVINSGMSNLEFNMDVSTLPSWITVMPMGGIVAPGDTAHVDITANTSMVTTGNYSYVVEISTNDSGNPTLNLMITMEVLSQSLVANFSAIPLTGHPPLLVTFTDESLNNTSAAWSAINSWKWDFNDDGTIDSYEQNPAYTYPLPGLYTVRLIVGTNTGLTSTKIRNNYINVGNNALFVASPLNEIPDMVEDTIYGPLFIGGVFDDPDGDNITLTVQNSPHLACSISFGNLTLVPATDWFGTETIILRATDPFGLFAEHPVVVAVASVNDAPLLTIPTDLYFIRHSVFNVDFGQYINDPDNPDQDISIQVFTDPIGQQIFFAYTPVNAHGIQGQLSVAFSSPSDLAVAQEFQIQVNDNMGRQIAWGSFNMHVLEHFTPQLELEDNYQFTGQTVGFRDATLGNPDHWLWEFGDGNTSDEKNPAHQYMTAGIYDIRLTLGNSQVPAEDRQIFMPGLITLTGTAVTVTYLPNTWTIQGSPYNLFDNVVIEDTSTVTIEPNVVINCFAQTPMQIAGRLTAEGVTFRPQASTARWGGLRFTGNALRQPSELTDCEIVDAINPIIIEDSSPLISGVTITVSDTTTTVPERAVSITGNSAASITDTEIINYKGGILIETEGNLRDTPALTNVRIRNSSSSIRTDEDEDTAILLKGTATLDDVEINDYSKGLEIDANEAMNSTSPSLTNVRIRNTSSSIRAWHTGIIIKGNTAPSLTQIEIENVTTGILIDNVNPTLRDTPALTNVRIRNTSSSIRSVAEGIILLNTPNIIMENVEIDSFPNGMRIQADVRADSAPALSNVRIRNSVGGIRNQGNGLEIDGAVYARITGLEIDDYTTGLVYNRDTISRTENPTTLSNVRIRNTSSSLRQQSTGASFSGLGRLSLTNFEVTDYGMGIRILPTDNVSYPNPTLTDVKINNNMGQRDENIGIFLGSGVGGSLKNSIIEEAFIGILIAENNRTTLENNTILNCNTGMKASGLNPLPIKKQVIYVEDDYLIEHSGETFTAMELNGDGPWNVYQNTLFNYPRGVLLNYANLSFHTNIMWAYNQGMQPFINNNGILNCNYSNIYRPIGTFPGVNNINQEPMFVDAFAGDFHLTRNSPCIDAGNPILQSDPDGTIADMGAYFYLHRGSGTASPRFITVGSMVAFTNTSLGHDYPDTQVVWDINNDYIVESTQRSFQWTFSQPGVYNVRLRMQSGMLTDEIIYPAMVVVSAFSLQAPQNPQIAVNDPDILLNWDPVTETIDGSPVAVNFYIVYRSHTPDGFYNFVGFSPSTETTYNDVGATALDRAFYIILGFAGSREELDRFLENNQTIRK